MNKPFVICISLIITMSVSATRNPRKAIPTPIKASDITHTINLLFPNCWSLFAHFVDHTVELPAVLRREDLQQRIIFNGVLIKFTTIQIRNYCLQNKPCSLHAKHKNEKIDCALTIPSEDTIQELKYTNKNKSSKLHEKILEDFLNLESHEKRSIISSLMQNSLKPIASAAELGCALTVFCAVASSILQIEYGNDQDAELKAEFPTTTNKLIIKTGKITKQSAEAVMPAPDTNHKLLEPETDNDMRYYYHC